MPVQQCATAAHLSVQLCFLALWARPFVRDHVCAARAVTHVLSTRERVTDDGRRLATVVVCAIENKIPAQGSRGIQGIQGD